MLLIDHPDFEEINLEYKKTNDEIALEFMEIMREYDRKYNLLEERATEKREYTIQDLDYLT